MATQIVEKSEVQGPGLVKEGTIFRVLIAVSFCHLLNDTMQSLLPSIYPILKSSFHLNFGQIGLLTLTFQMTASILQPFIGHFTDHRPMPYSLPMGMVFTLIGLLLLAIAPSFPLLLLAASLIGMGSAVFHPESSRVARLASGGRLGMAQSVFQVGGNTGSALGPLLAAFVVLPHGQRGVAWFSLVALIAIVVLTRVSGWYKARLSYLQIRPAKHSDQVRGLSRGRVASAIAVLIALVFSKYFYLASFTSYYTFYLISRFHVGVRSSQIHLFAFLGAVAAGTLIGGPDRRPHWPQDCDLVLHSRGLADDLAAALRKPVLDGRVERRRRLSASLRLSRDSGLRSGTGSRKSGNDFWPVLRLCLWHGRHRSGDTGPNRRCYQHSLRL